MFRIRKPAPNTWISILISSYNTKNEYIKECLKSIEVQVGGFGIELVWINDGSTDENGLLLENELKLFINNRKYSSVKYKKFDENQGIAKCLAEGVKLCSHEIIIKMDSDDIMLPQRIKTQLDFMRDHPDCVMCGSNIQMFKVNENNSKESVMVTDMSTITWELFKKNKPLWFINHPSICYKKSAILIVGNYNAELSRTCLEDYDLELRILKKYGIVYNIPDVLLYYRVHSGQVTWNGNSRTPENNEMRDKIIQEILEE
jgi:glycosyltransferase involved in cell wall biosynthesis